MNFLETLVIYLIIGAGVGSALALRDRKRAPLWLTLGVLFWPIFLPLLFSPHREEVPPFRTELDALRGEVARIEPLPGELAALPAVLDASGRLREETDELSRLLREQEEALRTDAPALDRSERTREVLEARRADVERLRAARDGQEERALRLTAQIREAITKAHLARIGGAAPEELRKLMSQMEDEVGLLSGRKETAGAAGAPPSRQRA